MSKVYFKNERLKYGFLWMLILVGASWLALTFVSDWLAIILIIFAGLSLYTGIWGKNDDSKSSSGMACPKCKIFQSHQNLNIDKNSEVYAYGEDCFRTRESDGLNIYSFLCFRCNKVTEYASDPFNQSGHAVGGLEYFDSKKITKKDYKNAYDYAKKNNHLLALNKLKKIKI